LFTSPTLVVLKQYPEVLVASTLKLIDFRAPLTQPCKLQPQPQELQRTGE
jgi:hypothetical protein